MEHKSITAQSVGRLAKPGALQTAEGIHEEDKDFTHETVLQRIKKERKDKGLDAVPGPGHYNIDTKDKIVHLTNQMAPRYKENPFGSKLDRFRKKSLNSKTKPIVTDQITREETLKRDLYEHTGIEKKSFD